MRHSKRHQLDQFLFHRFAHRLDRFVFEQFVFVVKDRNNV